MILRPLVFCSLWLAVVSHAMDTSKRIKVQSHNQRNLMVISEELTKTLATSPIIQSIDDIAPGQEHEALDLLASPAQGALLSAYVHARTANSDSLRARSLRAVRAHDLLPLVTVADKLALPALDSEVVALCAQKLIHAAEKSPVQPIPSDALSVDLQAVLSKAVRKRITKDCSWLGSLIQHAEYIKECECAIAEIRQIALSSDQSRITLLSSVLLTDDNDREAHILNDFRTSDFVCERKIVVPFAESQVSSIHISPQATFVAALLKNKSSCCALFDTQTQVLEEISIDKELISHLGSIDHLYFDETENSITFFCSAIQPSPYNRSDNNRFSIVSYDRATKSFTPLCTLMPTAEKPCGYNMSKSGRYCSLFAIVPSCDGDTSGRTHREQVFLFDTLKRTCTTIFSSKRVVIPTDQQGLRSINILFGPRDSLYARFGSSLFKISQGEQLPESIDMARYGTAIQTDPYVKQIAFRDECLVLAPIAQDSHTTVTLVSEQDSFGFTYPIEYPGVEDPQAFSAGLLHIKPTLEMVQILNLDPLVNLHNLTRTLSSEQLCLVHAIYHATGGSTGADRRYFHDAHYSLKNNHEQKLFQSLPEQLQQLLLPYITQCQ